MIEHEMAWAHGSRTIIIVLMAEVVKFGIKVNLEFLKESNDRKSLN